MPFHHKNIRLRGDNYLGTGQLFVTICCANRRKFLTDEILCQQLLDLLYNDAALRLFAVGAYCLMPDHIHLLLEGRDDDQQSA